MSHPVPDDSENAPPLRGSPTEGWRWQDNELSCLFEPIIGPAASALYCHLTGKAYRDKVTYTLRSLAAEMKQSRTTVWRSLAVLNEIGMVRIRRGGGSQESECYLVNLKKLAVSLGASYDRRAASYVLTPSRSGELREQIKAMQCAMQSNYTQGQETQLASDQGGGNLFLLDSKRDAGVSPERRDGGPIYYYKKQDLKTSQPLPLPKIAQRKTRNAFPTKKNRTSWCDGHRFNSPES